MPGHDCQDMIARTGTPRHYCQNRTDMAVTARTGLGQDLDRTWTGLGQDCRDYQDKTARKDSQDRGDRTGLPEEDGYKMTGDHDR
jgi:hypothetical protein